MKTRIKRIEIKNYRQYENVELDLGESKNVYAFVARNSAGKSNFINAISWCLYGDEPLKTKDNTDTLLPHHLALKPDTKHSKIMVRIEAELEGERVLFSRSRVEVDGGDLDQNKFEVFLYQDGGYKLQANPSYFVQNFLPSFLRDFFMFNGESVKTTFEKGYEKKIEKNVHAISYVTLIESTLKHLNILLQENRRDAGRVSPGVAGMSDQILELEKQLEKETEELAQKKSTLSARESKVKEMKAKQDTLERHKLIIQRKREIEQQISSEYSHLASYETNYRHLIGRLAPFIYMYRELGDFSVALNQLEAKGEIPPKVTSEFVEDLISKKGKGSCICGHNIGEDSVVSYKSLLEAIKKAENKGFLVKSNNNLAHINREIERSFNAIRDLKNNIIETRSKIDDLTRAEQEISKQITETGDDAATLEHTITKYLEEVKDIERSIWQLEDSIEKANQTRDDLDRKLKENAKQQEELKIYMAKSAVLEELVEKFKELLEKNVQLTRSALSGTMKKFFQELFWREDYIDIALDDNYEIIVMKDINGVPVRQAISALSSGEKASLGYSLIKGLAELSGFKQVPVFIDGPISDLDEGTVNNFLDILPSFMPEKQLFVFFKSDESLVEPYISKHLSAMEAYRLNRPKEYGPTTVEKWS